MLYQASSSNSPAPAGEKAKGVVIEREPTPPMNKEQRAVLVEHQNRPEKADKRPPHGGQGSAKDKNVSHAHSAPETRGANPGMNLQVQEAGPRPLPVPNMIGRDQVLDLLQVQLGPGFRPVGRPMYRKPHTEEVDGEPFPMGHRVPEFQTFTGENMQSTVEHITQFQVQCGEAGTNDKLKLRLFPNPLIATAFPWYINLPPNSIHTWAQLEEMFHQQFYRVEPEITMVDLSRYRPLPQEGMESYLLRFKTARFKCKIPLPEAEHVRLVLNGLDFEFKKKYHGTKFRDVFELSAKASRYEKLLVEEKDKKAASKGTYYQDPNYDVVAVETEASVDVDVAEIVNRKPYVCKAFVKMEPTKQPIQETSNRPTKAYTFDISKAEAIFDQLLANKLLKLPFGHKISTLDELKGKEYCKYHNSWSHSTNNCFVFRNDIQDKIDREEFKFPEKDK
ncbi:uncharacterized protein LOC131328528 [Rhododendron vialii]|uniref:uncharacterized protein LOC131328528 n=1 Tax=Rhododendron vialii TaxID=182163 RepID=UPI00265FCC64|nr:uncharacterized protein LOC131328528 [Rhododendron vialii]